MNIFFLVELEWVIVISYEILCYFYGEDIDVVVCFSVIAEDLFDVSFVG